MNTPSGCPEVLPTVPCRSQTPERNGFKGELNLKKRLLKWWYLPFPTLKELLWYLQQTPYKACFISRTRLKSKPSKSCIRNDVFMFICKLMQVNAWIRRTRKRMYNFPEKTKCTNVCKCVKHQTCWKATTDWKALNITTSYTHETRNFMGRKK